MKITVTRKIPGIRLSDLEKLNSELWISQFDRPLSSQEIIDYSKGTDYLLSLLTDKIDGEVMDAIGPQLKLISNYAVGFDNIDIAAATQRGIVVTNTPCDEVNVAVAEHTWALTLAIVRRIVEADEATKRGAYKGWEADIFIGNSLFGKTFGIIGLGRIGSMAARMAKGFGVNVIYTKREPDKKAEEELGIKYATLDELLSQSDVVSLHIPLNDETRHMITDSVFEKMKQGSYLINTARGPIVDEHALVRALRSGKLSGVALDVFDNEPNVNPELIGMENVILTPHIASATVDAREKMCDLAVSSIEKVIKGEKPENLVNTEVWDQRRK